MFYGYGYSLGRVSGGSVVPFDADAQAFITAASITDPAQQGYINTFYETLKADGIYTKMKAMYLPITGSASTSKFNMVNPVDSDAAFRLTFNGGWSFSSSGATPNGTTGFADTFITPSTHLSLNDVHMSFYSRTDSLTTEVEMGTSENAISKYFLLACGFNVGGVKKLVCHANDASNIPGNVAASTGLFVVSRTASNAREIYRNGYSIATDATASTALAPYKIAIGAYRDNASTLQNYSSKQWSFASIGTGLSDTENTNLYSAVNTLMTSLGINV